jgi:type VI secretion system secreted protein Hcp
MAIDMFLKLDGIKGESKDAKHKDEIHIERFQWGLEQPHDAFRGGMATGKVHVKEIVIQKYVDCSSPDLLLCISNGKHIKEGYIILRKAGEQPLEYLKIKLTQILITGLEYDSEHSTEELLEVLKLGFDTYHVSYQEQDANGKAKGGAKEMAWSIKQNTKL